MANYYHVRIISSGGTRYEAETVAKLSVAVQRLQALSGLHDLPYQTIGRALKASGLWVEAAKVPHLSDLPCLLVIEQAPLPPADHQANLEYWEQNPQHPARRAARAAESAPVAVPLAAPAGYVREQKPLVLWTEADWQKYREGSQIFMFVEDAGPGVPNLPE